MAVRPIDAVQVVNDINLHHKPIPVSEFESGFNYGLNQAMWEIAHAPTLTQPNEPLTCEECIYEHNEHENCNYCNRAPYLGDYYYRRPLEGGDDESGDD